MNIWDQRYSKREYVYGKSPNEFFKSEIIKNGPGKLLLPGEGEGRNAVFAASLDWEVTAFDFSGEAKQKATELAREKNVQLSYLVGDFNHMNFELNYFDSLALIYVHPPNIERQKIHQRLLKFLKPGGNIILEGFSKNQLGKPSGGPKNLDMLFSVEDLKNDFATLSELEVYEQNVIINEGIYHKGNASVIRLLGKKSLL